MRKNHIRYMAVAAAATIAAGLFTAVPVQAADGPFGRVIANGGLRVRTDPLLSSGTSGLIPQGNVIPIDCKVRGDNVDGNNLWYALPGVGNEWVSARYVANVGPAPAYCYVDGGGFAGMTTVTLNVRSRPTPASTLRGVISSGNRIEIDCKVRGANVDGNSFWYALPGVGNEWVSARYVRNIGAAPPFC